MTDSLTFIKALECPICVNIFNDPRCIPCGHTLCKVCLENLATGTGFSCPICRKFHDLAKNDIRSFTSNYSILSLINTLCKRCQKPKQLQLCSHCSEHLCPECTNIHVKELHSDIKKSLRELQESVREAQSILSHLKPNLDIDPMTDVNYVIEALKMKVAEFEENLKKQIHTQMAPHHDWLTEFSVQVKEAEKYHKMNSTITGSKDQLKQLAVVRVNCEDRTRNILTMKKKQPAIKSITLDYNLDNITRSLQHCVTSLLNNPGRDSSTVCEYRSTSELPHLSRIIGKRDGSGELQGMFAIAVCPKTGRLFVSDRCNNRIKIYNEKGCFATSMVKHLTKPEHLCVTPWEDLVVICDETTVIVFDENLQFKYELTGYWETPCAVAADNKHIYVCDCFTHVVRVFSKGGKPTRDLHLDRRLPGPCHMAVTDTEVILSSQNNIYHFTKEGKCAKIVVKVTRGDILAMVVNTYCDLFVASKYDGIVMVSKGKDAKNCIGKGQAGAGYLSHPNGLALNRHGELFVINYDKDNVLVYRVA